MTESIEYPIDVSSLNREAWQRRVSSCLITSLKIQQQAIPTLLILKDLLMRLLQYPIESTLKGKGVEEFFFTRVLPPICQKIISSEKIKCVQVLSLANTIMDLSLDVYNKYTQQVWQYPKLAELIIILFNPQATYFRIYNQLQIKSYVNNSVIQPWQQYDPQPIKHKFIGNLKLGDHLDVLKYQQGIKKAIWSRAELLRRTGSILEVRFIRDTKYLIRMVEQDSIEIAPLGSKSTDFEWRMSLKVGDEVDSYYLKTLLLLMNNYGISQKFKDSPRTLINVITQTKNTDLIGVCSKLLQHLESSSELFDQEILKIIWWKRLFGKSINCKSPQARADVYELIVKIASQPKDLIDYLWTLSIDILQRVHSKSKILTFYDQQIHNNKEQLKQSQPQTIVYVAQPIHAQNLVKYFNEITQDNILHQLEINLFSKNVTKFFIDLLKLQIPPEKLVMIIEFIQKMMFNVWIKNSTLKEIVQDLQQAIRIHPLIALSIVRNKDISNLLLEGSDGDIRQSIAMLLSSCVTSYVNSKKLSLTAKADNIQDIELTTFLDELFNWIPENVAKQWQSFSQYFEFWRHLIIQSKTCFDYLMRKRAISHFIEFQFQQKSPLKLYANKKYSFGDNCTQSNFSALSNVVSQMIEKVNAEGSTTRLESTDKQILTDFNFLDKIISDKNNNFAKKIIPSSCKNNLHCSEKVAIVLLKGFHESSYETVQPYLDVAETFVTIKDNFQKHRLMWVLGDATIVVSTTLDMKITALNSNSLKQRLYLYHSSIHYKKDCSILEIILKQHNHSFNDCAAVNLRSLLQMCLKDKFILDYVYKLPPPNYLYGRYYSFFKEMIIRYKNQAEMSNYNALSRKELSKILEEKYCEFANYITDNYVKITQPQKINVDQIEVEAYPSNTSQYEIMYTTSSYHNENMNIESNYNQSSKIERYQDDTSKTLKQGLQQIQQKHFQKAEHNRANQKNYQQTSERIVLSRAPLCCESNNKSRNEAENAHISEKLQAREVPSEWDVQMTWYPYTVEVKVSEEEGKSDNNKKILKRQIEDKGVKIRFFDAQISEIYMPVEGRKRHYFKDLRNAFRLVDRLKNIDKKKKKNRKSCLQVQNISKENMRVHWEFGCALLGRNDTTWIWSSNYIKLFKTDKEIEWPRWSLYDS